MKYTLKNNEFDRLTEGRLSSTIHHVMPNPSRAKKSGSHSRHAWPQYPSKSCKSEYVFKSLNLFWFLGYNMCTMGSAFFSAAEHDESFCKATGARKNDHTVWNWTLYWGRVNGIVLNDLVCFLSQSVVSTFPSHFWGCSLVNGKEIIRDQINGPK